MLLIFIGTVQACDSFRTGVYPAPPPTSAAVFNDYAAFEAVLGQIGGNDPVQAYVATGYLLAQQECLKFFTNLRLLRNDTDFAKDIARNVMASAGLISALASVPTAVLAGLFGATGVVPGVIGDFQNIFLFAAAGDSLYPQIYTAMEGYRQKFRADDPTQVNRLNADMRVRQHAAICSVPFLTYVVATGLKETKIEVDKPGERTLMPPPAPGIVRSAPQAPSGPSTTPFGGIVLQ